MWLLPQLITGEQKGSGSCLDLVSILQAVTTINERHTVSTNSLRLDLAGNSSSTKDYKQEPGISTPVLLNPALGPTSFPSWRWEKTAAF
jgi:hypothetical protein